MYSVNGNCFRISVRNLVEFMCAEGDIDNRNTGSNDVKIMQEGARIHRKIQHSMGTMYHAEVPLKIEIPLVSDLGIEYVLQLKAGLTVLLQILIMTRMVIKIRRAMQ